MRTVILCAVLLAASAATAAVEPLPLGVVLPLREVEEAEIPWSEPITVVSARARRRRAALLAFCARGREEWWRGIKNVDEHKGNRQASDVMTPRREPKRQTKAAHLRHLVRGS